MASPEHVQPLPDAVVDVVMPARNEAATVATNVQAAAGCRYVRAVLVADDGSSDDTASLAAAAGARVVTRHGPEGSKAHAMRRGVEATDASHILFVDADCLGLTSGHLDAICEPVVSGRAEMSIGAFDYPWFNWWVLRAPSLSGERIVPRWVWDLVPEDKLAGYTIESRLNEVVGRAGLRISVRTMLGVRHRTKRDKLGFVEGILGTLRMAWDLIAMLRPVGDVRYRTFVDYRRGLTIEEPARRTGVSS